MPHCPSPSPHPSPQNPPAPPFAPSGGPPPLAPCPSPPPLAPCPSPPPLAPCPSPPPLAPCPSPPPLAPCPSPPPLAPCPSPPPLAPCPSPLAPSTTFSPIPPSILPRPYLIAHSRCTPPQHSSAPISTPMHPIKERSLAGSTLSATASCHAEVRCKMAQPHFFLSYFPSHPSPPPLSPQAAARRGGGGRSHGGGGELLHVVVVGGGPTGVEVAAAVHDMVQGDLYRLYPALKGKTSVSLLQSGDHILNMFDLRISEFAARKFQRDGITVHTHARVTAVTPRALHVRETSSSRESGSSDGSKSGVHCRSSAESSSGAKSSGEREVPYGVVVWATGITAHPLVVKLREQLEQRHKRALEVDEWMAVRGAEAGSMWALGDCAAIHHRPFTDDTARIFRAFDTNGDGCLSPSETKAALRALQQRYPHAAALLKSRNRMAQLIQDALHADSKAEAPPGAAAGAPKAAPAGAAAGAPRGAAAGTGAVGNEGGEQQACEGRGLSLEQFEAVLRRVEGQMKTLPATAQVAAQQGQYVARCFNRLLDPALPPEGPMKLRGEGRHLLQPFRYVHLGQFAPLGSETTAAELPGDWVSIGRSTQWLWYSVYARGSWNVEGQLAPLKLPGDWVGIGRSTHGSGSTPGSWNVEGQLAPLKLPGDWVGIGRSTQWLWFYARRGLESLPSLSILAAEMPQHLTYLCFPVSHSPCSKQVSARTRALVVFDWIKSALFGRDSSRM
ncbi:unnamed protein product [Closterium sp. Naga37s-1]|nr:unnamed protein product [Closterium sp. Naga37s-1]